MIPNFKRIAEKLATCSEVCSSAGVTVLDVQVEPMRTCRPVGRVLTMTRVLVVGALAATACSESSPPLASPSPPIPPVPVPPQSFTLTGTLLLTAPGGTRGIAGKLEVAINDTVNRRVERRLVETAPDGRYTVPDLSLGTVVNLRLDEFSDRPPTYTQPCAAWAMMSSAKVVDVEVVAVGGRQTIHGSPTLSGTVYRSTSAGRVPLANVGLLFDAKCDDGSTDAATVSDAQGRYEFCRLPAGKSCIYAFGTMITSVEVDIVGDATVDIDVDPPPPPPPPNIDGNYTLVLESSCAALPMDVRRRTYTATITGSPKALVTLGGATFWSHPSAGLLNTFSGLVTAEGVSLTLSAPAAAGFGIVERTSETKLLEFIGYGNGTIAGASIGGTLQAGVGFGEDLRNDSGHVGCLPHQHQVTFRFTQK